MSDRPIFSDAVLPPTAARWAKGDVRRSEHQVVDAAGAIGDPFITLSALARMHAGGRISTEMAKAGNQFHTDFVRAHLLGLHARGSDLFRAPVGTTGRPGDHATLVYIHRERVWNALEACRGPSSPCGSCGWHCLGLEESVKDWALTRYVGPPRISEHAVAGVLIGVLGCLEAHYQRGQRGA